MDEAVATTRAHYDAVAADFDRRTRHGYPELAAQLDAFRDLVVPGGIVVDAGCGPGRDLAQLRARGLAAFGVDLSLGMLREGPRTGTAQADLRALPLRSASLDGIWCNAALLHIPQRDVPGVLEGFARAARPGSPLHLCVAEGDGEGWEDQRWFSYQREPGLSTVLGEVGWRIRAVAHRTSHRDWLMLTATRE